MLLILEQLCGIQNTSRRKDPHEVHQVSSDLESQPSNSPGFCQFHTTQSQVKKQKQKPSYSCPPSMVQGLSLVEFSNFLFGFS